MSNHSDHRQGEHGPRGGEGADNTEQAHAGRTRDGHPFSTRVSNPISIFFRRCVLLIFPFKSLKLIFNIVGPVGRSRHKTKVFPVRSDR